MNRNRSVAAFVLGLLLLSQSGCCCCVTIPTGPGPGEGAEFGEFLPSEGFGEEGDESLAEPDREEDSETAND